MAPVIDGNLNDEVWLLVPWSGDFTQKEPQEFSSPSQQTDFRILYDDRYVYVAIMAWDDDPQSIEQRLGRRDSFEGDWVGIAFDSYNDDLTGFSFAVTASGVKNDLIVTNDVEMDDTWDPVWDVKTSVTDSGWSAEMRIPLTQLRFASGSNMSWGLEVMRQLFDSKEFMVWQMVPNESASWVGMWGDLEGISDLNAKREVELIPYLMGGVTLSPVEEGNPFATGSSLNYNMGLDGKIAVTNDLTLNFTINPDFGQVEADPSQVNLTAFESYFQEKRPFFVEGSNIFSFSVSNGEGPTGRDNLFYSRRVGRQPQYWPEAEEGEHIKMPEYSRILGAFKLSGKTQNGWSVGIMESLTGETYAVIDSSGTRTREAVEPMTNYANVRLQKDLNKGMTSLGGMITSTNRFINDSMLDFLPSSAYSGGLDFSHRWGNKNYYLRAKALASSVGGSEEAILDLQTAPARYYQRPDVGHHRLDSSLRLLSGWGGNVEAAKVGGGHWRYGSRITALSPGLELNDQGFLRRADFVTETSWVGYEWWVPTKVINTLEAGSEWMGGWDFSGQFLYWSLASYVHTQFVNYWSAGASVNFMGFDVDRPALRGGPALRAPSAWTFNVWGNTDTRKPLVMSFSFGHGISYQGYGDWYSANAELSYRVATMVQVSIAPGYFTGDAYSMYIDTFGHSDPLYLVGSLNQHILNMDLRLDLSLTPVLTLQYWAQPFVFSGKYTNLMRVVDPGIKDAREQYEVLNGDVLQFNADDNHYTLSDPMHPGTVYTFENPDFSFFEFRSNLVVRWEYIPGSTAYLVWSQGRTGDTPNGDFTLTDHFNDLIQVDPTNVIMLKLSYRISM